MTGFAVPLIAGLIGAISSLVWLLVTVTGHEPVEIEVDPALTDPLGAHADEAMRLTNEFDAEFLRECRAAWPES